MSTGPSRLGAALLAVALPFVGPAHAEDSPKGCKRIASVRIVRIDVFDPRIPEEDRALFRLANTLHIETRESTVKQLLLFQPGDLYDPRVLQESVRVMRSTGYMHDAAVRTVACPDGEAEIEVAVQDVWTLKPTASFGRKGGRSSSAFGIEETNLFGTGAQLGLDFKNGVDRNTRMLSYHDPLLGGQRLDLTASHARNSDGNQSTFGLARPFYALDSRWAGGLALRHETRVDSSYEQGQVVGQYQVAERYAQLYGGYSEGLLGDWVTRWTAGWTHDEHQAQPVLSQQLPVARPPADRRLVYPWLGAEWVQNEFREARNLDQIGKSEDLALGWHITAQFGLARPAFGADRNAGVFSLKLARGLQPWRGHTLLFDGSAEGRFEDRHLTGTLFSGSVRYHLQQSDQRSLFLLLSADRAVRPDADQQVLLGGDSGLRGYPMRYQSGKGRWLLTTEQRWFSDWYVWRIFNVGGAVFYDMGRTWEPDSRYPSPQQGLLRDLGFGLRLGNSRSAVGSVLHLDLAFPLDGDRSVRKVQLQLEAKRSF